MEKRGEVGKGDEPAEGPRPHRVGETARDAAERVRHRVDGEEAEEDPQPPPEEEIPRRGEERSEAGEEEGEAEEGLVRLALRRREEPREEPEDDEAEDERQAGGEDGADPDLADRPEDVPLGRLGARELRGAPAEKGGLEASPLVERQAAQVAERERGAGEAEEEERDEDREPADRIRQPLEPEDGREEIRPARRRGRSGRRSCEEERDQYAAPERASKVPRRRAARKRPRPGRAKLASSAGAERMAAEKPVALGPDEEPLPADREEEGVDERDGGREEREEDAGRRERGRRRARRRSPPRRPGARAGTAGGRRSRREPGRRRPRRRGGAGAGPSGRAPADRRRAGGGRAWGFRADAASGPPRIPARPARCPSCRAAGGGWRSAKAVESPMAASDRAQRKNWESRDAESRASPGRRTCARSSPSTVPVLRWRKPSGSSYWANASSGQAALFPATVSQTGGRRRRGLDGSRSTSWGKGGPYSTSSRSFPSRTSAAL